ncbi:MAG: hypothetical protein HQM08_06410 [Candidatus Riflebacteria bacterium]|nr:hypothetical protein [Candidatus Riflebacteria bacterium]
MKKKKRIRVFIRKPVTPKGMCQLIENGIPCNRKEASRGLCGMHSQYLKLKGRLEEFALAPEKRTFNFRVKPNPEEGVCRLIVNGVPCSLPSRRRGLCIRHYAGIWQRPDLKLDDFASPANSQEIEFFRKKNPPTGICVVKEMAGKETILKCSEPVFARGFCKSHYRKLSQSPDLFDAIADPIREKAKYRLKQEIKPGICAIIQNNVGCTNPATGKRRVCRNHQLTLRKIGLLDELTNQFIPPKTVLEKKLNQDSVDGFCQVVVNGVPCRKVPKRRGICSSCINLIERNPEYKFSDFALPEMRQGESELKRKKEIIRGFCLIIENDEPCRKAATIRGLCRHHYRILSSRQRLTNFTLTEDEEQALPVIPHWYFDKNVVIDFVMKEVFQDAAVPEAAVLVQKVLEKKLFATISFDCVRAVYSKLGHRLTWPVNEGGKGLSSTDAEVQAREYTGKLFHGRGGLWHITANDPRHLELCTVLGKLPVLSLEDALEVYLFGIAQTDFGATLFVTSDRGILEKVTGLHPRDALKNFKVIQSIK